MIDKCIKLEYKLENIYAKEFCRNNNLKSKKICIEFSNSQV